MVKKFLFFLCSVFIPLLKLVSFILHLRMSLSCTMLNHLFHTSFWILAYQIVYITNTSFLIFILRCLFGVLNSQNVSSPSPLAFDDGYTNVFHCVLFCPFRLMLKNVFSIFRWVIWNLWIVSAYFPYDTCI